VSSVVLKCDPTLATPANVSALSDVLRIPVVPCVRHQVRPVVIGRFHRCELHSDCPRVMSCHPPQLRSLLSSLLLELPASSSVGSVWYSAVGDSLKGCRHVLSALSAVRSPLRFLFDDALPHQVLQLVHGHHNAVIDALQCEVPDTTSPVAAILTAQLVSARVIIVPSAASVSFCSAAYRCPCPLV
jgi:hypothetical protein